MYVYITILFYNFLFNKKISKNFNFLIRYRILKFRWINWKLAFTLIDEIILLCRSNSNHQLIKISIIEFSKFWSINKSYQLFSTCQNRNFYLTFLNLDQSKFRNIHNWKFSCQLVNKSWTTSSIYTNGYQMLTPFLTKLTVELQEEFIASLEQYFGN